MNAAQLLETDTISETENLLHAPIAANEWQADTMPARPQPPLLRLYDETAAVAKLIGTTCFFRNRPLLRTLLEQIDTEAREINVLVHAASIGADVYSLAIAWQLFFQGRRAPRLKCSATDLSPAFLKQAEQGIYPLAILEAMSDSERAYFEIVDATSCRVTREIRNLVTFLPPASYVTFATAEQFDVVILLNSLLYVSAADQALALGRISAYNTRHLLVTGYHGDSIERDLVAGQYEPVVDRFEEIYESWTCRRSLEPNLMIEGVTFHTPAMEALHPCGDFYYRFGALFRKQVPAPQWAPRMGIVDRDEAAKARVLPSVALFNDTGKVAHVGCRGVSLGHDKMLSQLGAEIRHRSHLGDWCELWKGDRAASLRAFHASALPALLEEVGAVVVNGEGTIHHGYGLHLLTILEGAQELGLPTMLVNAVFQECEQFTDMLRRLDDFTVRDARSAAYLQRLDIPHRIVLDSILEADFAAQPAHDFKDKIIITDWHPVRTGDVGASLQQLLGEFGGEAVYYPLEGPAREKDWRQAVADFRSARLVVTGRHHGVCLAGMAGVPFVALGSNTWKIEGLLELLPGNLRVLNDARGLRAACAQAVDQSTLYGEIHDFLRAQSPLTTFQKLADPSLGRREPKWSAAPAAAVTAEEKEFTSQLAQFFGSAKVLLVDWVDDQSVRVAPQHFDTVEVAPSNWSTEPSKPRLPMADAAYDTVVNLASLAGVSEAALPGWLAELHRVTGRNLWVAIEAVPARNYGWWEAKFVEAGFRAHARLGEFQAEPTPADHVGPVTFILEKLQVVPVRPHVVAKNAPRRTVCLATNYLLMTESTRQMWDDLGRHLAEQGCQLVLLSTMLPEKPFPFPVHQIPYYLRNYAEWFPQCAFTGDVNVSAKEMEWLRADMSRLPQGYTLGEAIAGLTAYRVFAGEMLRTLQPGLVLLADNMLGQTAVMQRMCADQGIPVQIYERGLLPETLMIESRGVQSLSDFRTNWLANTMPEAARDEAAYERLRSYYLARKPQKYVQPDFAGGGSALREKLGLVGQRIVLFLGGGFEANGHAPKGGNQERAYFPAFPSTNEALMGLWAVVEKMPNTALVFKPHPLDPETYSIAKIEGVCVVTDVNVHALIEAADVVAVQFTTLQFETVFYDKPILLLGRTVWWGRNATYEVDGADQLSAVLNEALTKRNWPVVQANARAFNVWLMDQFLVGCTLEVPTRQNLRDLAGFIGRIALDSRNLPTFTERLERAEAAYLKMQGGATRIAAVPAVASCAATNAVPEEMTPDNPDQPNPLNGQPLLERAAWEKMLEEARVCAAASDWPKAFRTYAQIVAASSALNEAEQTILANDLAALLPRCLKSMSSRETDGLVRALRLHPALARQLVEALEKGATGVAGEVALALGTSYAAANRHQDALVTLQRAKSSGDLPARLDAGLTQWIEIESASVQARANGGWASRRPTPYPLAPDGRPKLSPVWLEVTSFCNQSCSFCPDPKRKTKRQYMTLEIFKRCVDELKRDFHVEYLQLNAYGEPLLHPQFEQILTYLRAGNSPSPFFFTTHGMTLNERNVAMLDRAHPDGICISLQNDGEASYAASRDLRIGNYEKLARQVRNLVERFVQNRRACHVRLYQLLSNGKGGFGVPEEVLSAFPNNWERFAASVRTWEESFRPLADNRSVWSVRNTDDQIREAFEQADHPAWWVKLDLLRWKDERGGEQSVFISPRPVGTYANTLPEHSPHWNVKQQLFNPGSCPFTQNPGLAIYSNGNLGICCLSVEQNAAFGRLQDFANLKEAVSSEGCFRMMAETANGVGRSDDCRLCLGQVEKASAEATGCGCSGGGGGCKSNGGGTSR